MPFQFAELAAKGQLRCVVEILARKYQNMMVDKGGKNRLLLHRTKRLRQIDAGYLRAADIRKPANRRRIGGHRLIGEFCLAIGHGGFPCAVGRSMAAHFVPLGQQYDTVGIEAHVFERIHRGHGLLRFKIDDGD